MTYADYVEWGYGPRIHKIAGLNSEEFDRLAVKVLALAEAIPADWTFPVHDPPVAWRAGEYLGFPMVACPGITVARFDLGELSSAIPVLDKMPGKH